MLQVYTCIKVDVQSAYPIFVILGTPLPGPLKCFSAPCRQILAKRAPQKARNRDKAEFATNVRKSSQFDLNPKNLKGHI